MPLTLADFWKRCLASGLTDTSMPRQWAASYAQDHQSTPPTDPLKLAKWLVKTKRLLPFQASSLIQGSPDITDSGDGNSPPRIPKLRIAPITQSQDKPPEAFPGWLGVTRDATEDSSGSSSKKPRSGVLWQVDPRRLRPEDGDRLRQLANARHPGLPALELVALPGGPLGHRAVSIPVDQEIDCVGLFAPLPAGQSLGEALKSQSKWPIDRIVALVKSIATPLQISSLTVRTSTPAFTVDHVWLPQKKSPILWIDPVEHLASGVTDSPATVRQTESRLLYAAPELFQPMSPNPALGSVADERSTVYALGCLGYRLRTGNHAFSAAKEEQIRSRQINFNPPELAEAMEKGAAGDPFFRVIAYAMNKDVGSRFATIENFIAALNATVPAEEEVAEEDAPVQVKKPTPAKVESKPVEPVKEKPAPKAKPIVASEAKPTASLKAKPTVASKAKTPAKIATKRPAAESPGKVVKPTAAPPSPKAPEPRSVEPAAQPAAQPAIQPAVEPKIEPEIEPEIAVQPPAVPPVAEAAATIAVAEAAATVAVAATSLPASVTHAAPSQDAAYVAPAARKRPSRRRTTWFVLHSLWIPIFLLIVINALHDPSANRPVAKRVRPPIPAVIPSVSGTRPKPPPIKPTLQPKPEPLDTTTTSSIEVVDNEQMLWAPPSLTTESGQPGTAPEKPPIPATALLPPGPAAVVTIDYPNLIATGLRDTFDPEIAPVLSALTKRIGVPLDDVRLIAMAWFPGVDGIPSVAVAVHLKTPKPVSDLEKLWEASEAMGKGGVKLFAGDDPDGFAYYPSSLSTNPIFDSSETDAGGESDGKTLVTAFAVGTIDQITDVAEVEGAAVLLPRQLEELWKHAEPTDAIALLTQPNFLVADARGWVNGLAPPLMDWIRSTLIPECGGILLRVATAENRSSYVEARLATAPGMSPTKLRSKIGDRLDQAPGSADDFLVTREVDPSWRLLASRLPTMWAFASDQTRSMIVDREVVFNTYLPPMALPQLTLATLLASNTNAMTAVAGVVPAGEKLTLDQMLDRPMSITFGQESLQFAVDNITTEFGDDLPKGNQLPPVEIIGSDLQLMGITQNQQIRDFSKKDVPLRTVLTDLVLGANPDRTATGPDDPKQALVWVVFGEGAETKIFITTREASKGKYDLPREFQTKP